MKAAWPSWRDPLLANLHMTKRATLTSVVLKPGHHSTRPMVFLNGFIWEKCFLQKGSCKIQRPLQRWRVFLSQRLGEFRGSKADGQVRASPKLFQEREQQNAKVKFPLRNFSNLTSACLVGGLTLPLLQCEGLLLQQTDTSSTINTSVWRIHLSYCQSSGMEWGR